MTINNNKKFLAAIQAIAELNIILADDTKETSASELQKVLNLISEEYLFEEVFILKKDRDDMELVWNYSKDLSTQGNKLEKILNLIFKEQELTHNQFREIEDTNNFDGSTLVDWNGIKSMLVYKHKLSSSTNTITIGINSYSRIRSWQAEDKEILRCLMLSAAHILHSRDTKSLEKLISYNKNLVRQKELVMANVSHEIRNPINVIYGMSDIILNSKDLTPETRQNIESIKFSSEILLDITSSILKLSQFEYKNNRVNLESFNLQEFLKNLDDTYKPNALTKGLELRVTNHNFTNSLFIGDLPKLRQIIFNLMDNALKFTNKGGIALDCFIEDMNMEKMTCLMRIDISDTGIGIKDDDQKQIFEIFSQANMKISEDFGGSGMGLAIAKGLVEVLNGAISIDSTPGEGSTFSIELPMQIAENVEDQSDPNDIDLSNKKILVVEDSEMNMLVITKILNNANGKVIGLNKSKETMSTIEKNDFDLVILDVRMPDLDGYELTKLIRGSENEKIKELPIIGVTANALERQKRKGLSVGMNDYIIKPFKKETLLESIWKLLK